MVVKQFTISDTFCSNYSNRSFLWSYFVVICVAY